MQLHSRTESHCLGRRITNGRELCVASLYSIPNPLQRKTTRRASETPIPATQAIPTPRSPQPPASFQRVLYCIPKPLLKEGHFCGWKQYSGNLNLTLAIWMYCFHHHGCLIRFGMRVIFAKSTSEVLCTRKTTTAAIADQGSRTPPFMTTSTRERYSIKVPVRHCSDAGMASLRS